VILKNLAQKTDFDLKNETMGKKPDAWPDLLIFRKKE
jgi:hypothetical protein